MRATSLVRALGLSSALVLAVALPARAQQPAGPPAGLRVYDVRAYGATGDGRTIDSPAILRAIDAAAVAGGGTVYLPPGTYASYSIRLKSNVTIYLEAGATLLAADSLSKGYDPPEPNAWDRYQDFGHSHWHNSLIWGEGLHDVGIVGPGLIDGAGLSHGRGGDPAPGVANKAIALKQSHNVLIRDVSIVRGGHFAILLTGVDNTTIDNVKIDTNRDGIDVDASRNVRISNVSVNSPWDDAIVLKASYALGAARPTEDVTIVNCLVAGGWKIGSMLDGSFRRLGPEDVPGPGDRPGVPTGRIKLGTESNGDFRNITISNVTFETSRGLALESVDGAHLEGITVSNITMRGITDGPIFIRLGRRMRAPQGMQIGTIRHVVISDVVLEGSSPRYAAFISGIPGHPVQDVQLSHLRLVFTGGAPAEQAKVQVPENEAEYPELARFGAIPAWALYIRHAEDVELDDVGVALEQPDPRPAFVLDDVRGADFHHVRAPRGSGASLFALKDVWDLAVSASAGMKDVRKEHVSAGSF